MAWLIQRVRDILTGPYPWERQVCLMAFGFRLVFILLPALAVWEWLPRVAMGHGDLWVRGLSAWAAGAGGALVWADLGPEEAFRKWTLGYSWNPNVFPTGTLEAWCGPVDRIDLRAWESLKTVSLRPWDGQPGSE